MFKNEAQTLFFENFVQSGFTLPRHVFTPEIMDQISAEFDIPATHRDMVGQILEAGCRQYALEKQSAALDFKSVRKDLRKVEQAAKALVTALDNATPDTRTAFDITGQSRTLAGFPLPRISLQSGALVLDLEQLPDGPSQRIALAELRAVLAALGQCAIDARRVARVARKGRPENEALNALMPFALLVWERMLGRAFKLDWASKGEAITDAARFSVRIAQIVDAELTLQQIANAARKVRENSKKFHDLEKIPEVRALYPKRIE